MQLVPDLARALVPAERVDARVAAAVLDGGALVELLHEGGREAGFLHRAVRLEDHEQLVGGGPEGGVSVYDVGIDKPNRS